MSATLADLGTLTLDLSNNPIQKAFIGCNSRFQNFSGGFGSGKTTACCLKGQILSRIFPNNLGVVCRRTYPDLRDTTRKTFIEILPEDSVLNWKESENALMLKNRSTILFRHFENGTIKVGSSIGWFFLDQAEEAEEAIFKGLVGRLRRPVPRHIGMIAMNPNGQDWQWKLFVGRRDPDYAHFDSTTYDNQANLPPNYISDMLTLYSQEWIDRFVFGKWNKMSGLIYHEFEESRHMVDLDEVPTLVKARGLDWGVDAPATCVFVGQASNKVYYVFDEYGAREKTAYEHADNIVKQSKGLTIRGNVLDSSAFRKGEDLKSVADKYRERGIVCQPATKDLLGSIIFVKQLLKTDRLKFVRGKTDKTIEEIRSWKWGAKTNGKEIPAKGNDHYLDALRYVLDWMSKRQFFSGGERMIGKSPRPVAFLSKGPAEKYEADPVTGLPA